jgi:diguanylate cyclase (GGDEF)-like protein
MGQALLKDDVFEPAADRDRLVALDRYDALDTGREEAFDRIARLIKLTLGVEVGIVSLMDAHRQWYKAVDGFSTTEVPLQSAFCKHLLADPTPIVVPDATLDERFRDNPYVVGDPHVRFYAGAPLTTSDGFHIGSVCAIDSAARHFGPREKAILTELAHVAMNELELRRLAATDALTGVSSRRAFKDEAGKFVALARRHRSALSCITFDLDHFKSVNDTYGHAAGDQVLAAVSELVTGQLRRTDLFGRLGGEEFAVLLPHTDQHRAYEAAEKLRLAIRTLKIPGSHPPIAVSASLGVASLDPVGDDIDSLLQKADEALYAAKRAGRNRSAMWQPAGTAVQAERRRVLKAGRIVFMNRHAVTECTVRSLWENGAELALSSTLDIPDAFQLQIRSDGAEWACEVAGRTEQRLIVSFV